MTTLALVLATAALVLATLAFWRSVSVRTSNREPVANVRRYARRSGRWRRRGGSPRARPVEKLRPVDDQNGTRLPVVRRRAPRTSSPHPPPGAGLDVRNLRGGGDPDGTASAVLLDRYDPELDRLVAMLDGPDQGAAAS